MFNSKETITEEFISFYEEFKQITKNTVSALSEYFKEPEPLPPPTLLEQFQAYLASYNWTSVSAVIAFVALMTFAFSSSKRHFQNSVDFWMGTWVSISSIAKPILMQIAVAQWTLRYYNIIVNSRQVNNAGQFVVLVEIYKEDFIILLY